MRTCKRASLESICNQVQGAEERITGNAPDSIDLLRGSSNLFYWRVNIFVGSDLYLLL